MEQSLKPLEQQESMHILLVEDNQHDVLAMQRVLQKSTLNCRITVYARAEALLSVLTAQAELSPHVDLIICDQKLPGMTGMELYKTIRAQDVLIPFVLLTGSGAEELAVEALKLGVSDYIMKDQQSRYLQLLPTILPQVVAREKEQQRRREAEQMTVKRGQMLASLVEVQKVLLSFDAQTDLQRAYQKLLGLLSDLLQADRVYIFETQYGEHDVLHLSLEAERHLTTLPPIHGQLGTKVVPFTQVLPPWSEVILNAGSVLSNQAWMKKSQTPHYASYPVGAHLMGEASHATRLHEATLYLPLRSQGKLLGVFAVEKRSFAGPVDEAEIDLLRGIAAAISQWREQRHSEQQLRAYAEEMKQQNQELDAFAHMVAHDLKNPLSVLSTTSDVLSSMQSELTQQETYEMIALIQEYTQKAINIVNELLLLSSTRREDVDVEPVSMGPVVKNAIQQLQHLISEKEAVIELPSQWPLALGHAPWLEAVWVNYISNALKYGGTPPRLTLGASRQGDGIVCFWVKDNGDGIQPDEQKKLFTPFTRLAQYKAQGNGLGLSIVSRVIQKLGGDVGVESTGRAGEGSRFYFTLPVAHLQI